MSQSKGLTGVIHMLFRRRSNVDGALELLAKGDHELRLRVSRLEEALEALQTAHEALRGRFYASRKGGGDPEPTSKGAILREFGFRPGQPVPHK